MKRKKIKLKKSVYLIFLLSLVVIIGFILLTTNFKFLNIKSIHDDAKSYKTRHCLAFYPDSSKGLSYAKSLCKGVKDDSIYDYSLVPYGDYYLISYGNDNKYFADKNYEALTINELSDEGKKIVIDYLRYEIKKNNPEKYYDASFIRTLNYENVDFDNISYEIEGDSLKVTYKDYDYESYIPLKYLQKHLNMNFGFPDEIYRKPVYVDSDESHPIICLTFNDGPDFDYPPGVSTSEKIVNLLYEYDACATFYVAGKDLEKRDVWADYQAYYFLKRSINNGNSYGSFTQNRVDLTTIDVEDIAKEISEPISYMKDFVNYEMATYRPVSGEFDEDVLNEQPVGAVLWNVDSLDWMYDNSDDIYQTVMDSELVSGDIIIMHDIYDETFEALEKLIPELINEGYQLLTVEDMLKYYNIDLNGFKYFYNPDYYE